jgi:3-hydroxybutyryl-CoA dehydrogenase
MEHTRTIAVVGAGTMGTGIAQVCALAGLSVYLMDMDEPRVARGLATVTDGMVRLRDKGGLADDAVHAARGRLIGTTRVDSLRHCEFIVEAATEDPALKAKLLRQLDEAARDDAILATNTSSISIEKLAAATRRPSRFVGLHFFNPVPVMGLVEVVHGPRTEAATVEAAMALARRLGKTPVLVKDSPGFIVNRLLLPMLNEAVLACAEGIATASDIDQAMQLGCKHPIGPLALCDLIGIDVVLAALEVFLHDFADPKYRPAPLLKAMVDAGHLGRKSGQGFYTYPPTK